MSELLRELEEDLQSERLQKFWHSFGKAIIALSVAIVLFTAATVIWQNIERNRAIENTSQLIKGADRMRVEDYQGAIDAFAALAGKEPYATLAALRKAQAQAALGDQAAAAKTYGEAANRAGAFADLAGLMAADKKTASPDSPFFYSRSEQNAWLSLKEGGKDDARQKFSSLRDDKEAPKSLRRRAAMMADYLAPAAYEK